MAHDVDIYAGKQIRAARKTQGITQKALAEKIGVTFQQLQKYETGMNRVSVSRLWDIAQALKLPISYFFPEDVGG